MRKGLRWPLAGAVGLLIAVSLLVIPAMGQGTVTGEVGVLRLHLNSDGDRIVFDPSTGPDLTQTLTQTNCKLASTGDSLVSLVGSGTYPTKKPFAGLKEHRIGVGQNYEGTGEPCARINKDLGQKLTLGLLGGLADTDLGYADNTLVFYIWGDNGSSGEGQNGTISELLAQNGIPTTVDMHIAALEDDNIQTRIDAVKALAKIETDAAPGPAETKARLRWSRPATAIASMAAATPSTDLLQRTIRIEAQPWGMSLSVRLLSFPSKAKGVW
jgi:hypothetical protein